MSGSQLTMVERKEPEFVKFALGEMLEGVLLKLERIEVGDKGQRAIRYTVEDSNTRQAKCFLGTYQIDTMLRTHDIGHVISIVYLGDDSSVERNGNLMRKVQIKVSLENTFDAPKKGNKLEDGTYITDDDLPF